MRVAPAPPPSRKPARPKEFVAPKPNQAERHEAKAPACRPEASCGARGIAIKSEQSFRLECGASGMGSETGKALAGALNDNWTLQSFRLE